MDKWSDELSAIIAREYEDVRDDEPVFDRTDFGMRWAEQEAQSDEASRPTRKRVKRGGRLMMSVEYD